SDLALYDDAASAASAAVESESRGRSGRRADEHRLQLVVAASASMVGRIRDNESAAVRDEDADAELSAIGAACRRDGVLLARDGRGRERNDSGTDLELHDGDNDTAAAGRHRDLRERCALDGAARPVDNDGG